MTDEKSNMIHIVVIGGGYAGMIAAIRLAGKTRRQRVQVTLVNALDYFVERPLLHEAATGAAQKKSPIKQMLRGTKVAFVHGWVRAIQPEGRQIEIEIEGVQDRQTLSYDFLVYALGSQVDRESVPGVRDHAYVLDPYGPLTAADLKTRLEEMNGRAQKVVIVGGGATGVETAAQIKSHYPNLEISLLSRGEIGAFKGSKVQRHINEALIEQGVMLAPNQPVNLIESGCVHVANGTSVAADLCLWAGGFVASKIAREAGLRVNERHQILVDPQLRSLSHPNIYAVGDSAAPVEEPGVPIRMSLFTALVSGAQAADNLAARIKGKKEKALSFAYYGQGIALGPKDAVGFATYPADKVIGPIYRRLTAVRVRNFFVWYLSFVLEMERRWPGFLFWNGKRRFVKAQRKKRGLVSKPALN